MDGYLKNALDKIITMRKKDWDVVLVIDGLERSGKSVLAQQIAKYLDRELTIDQITFTPQEFRTQIEKSKKGRAIVLDEAITGLFSRQAMHSTNVELVKCFAQCGQKNLVLIVVLPSFFILDSYIAIHRSRALLHIYTRDLDRGYFTFFNVRRKKTLYLNGKKGYNYSVIKANFRGRFTNHYVVDEKEYRAKKLKALVGEEMLTKHDKMWKKRLVNSIPFWLKAGYSKKDIAKAFGITASNLRSILQ